MRILVLAESLRINETSSGIVTSTFLSALSDDNNIIDCIYEDSITYPITWLNGVNHFIKVTYKPYIENKIVKQIPKLRGLLTRVTGLHPSFKHKINDWKQKIENQLNIKEYDLIIALGSGSAFLPHYALIKVKTNIKVVMNFHDPYPYSWYPRPYKQASNIIYKWQEIYTKRIFRRATYLSFPSEILKNHMIHKVGISNLKTFVLPHVGCKLLNLPDKKDDNTIFLDKKKFNILHIGTLLGQRNVEALFNAYELFLSKELARKEKSVLNILGSIDEKHYKIIEKADINNFNIINKRVSYKKSLELIQQSNLALVVEAVSNYSPFMPGKLADLFFLEKTIFALTPKISETRRILGNQYPYISEANDTSKILTILEKLWTLWNNNNLYFPNIEKYKEYVSVDNFNKILKENIN